MLSASEIAELEKKVQHYRLKRTLHVLVYVFLFLTLIGTSIYLYVLFNNKTILKDSHIEDNVTTMIQDKTDTPEQKLIIPTTTTAIQDDKLLSADENETSSPLNETLELHLPLIVTSNNKTVKEQSESNIIPKEEEIPKKTFARKPLTKIEEPYYRSNEEKIESTMLAPPSILSDDAVKSKITIETQEINSIQYLKEKYEKTHNIIFALMLAEEYYLNKNYDESLKWALMANSIDAENEKSWLWFAKSKMKSGKKDDAITALQAYLKNNKSNAAQSLLNQITIGEFHE
ncbi:MAG: hypothetical protein PHN18_10765 [Sulfurospirillaceae bacterium]|nr:hypothetical protein [Sulfurospirillaceae bacterium]MDD2827377.1 hypothetical protein [Sulfurospirillaceae bacterium]